MKLKLVAAVTAALATMVIPTAAGAAPKSTAIGIIGNYSDDDMRSMRADGQAADALVELEWTLAEPTRGRFDEAYLGRIAERITTLRAMGYQIALNAGVQNAPEWLLRLPGARYVDQFGRPTVTPTSPT